MDIHQIAQFLIHTAQASAEVAKDAIPAAAELAQGAAPAAAEAAHEEAGVLGTLGIDWKLFIGQLINFAVLLFVMWKWVLPPIAKKLTERTEKIEKSLHDADRIAKEKKEFETWKDGEMAKARQEASSIVTAAQTDAQKAKQQIAAETKAEQEKIVAQAKRQIEDEKSRQLAEAKSELANMITTASEKIIRKKLDSKADQELIKESLGSIK